MRGGTIHLLSPLGDPQRRSRIAERRLGATGDVDAGAHTGRPLVFPWLSALIEARRIRLELMAGHTPCYVSHVDQQSGERALLALELWGQLVRGGDGGIAPGQDRLLADG
jgi:hypothetical protein